MHLFPAFAAQKSTHKQGRLQWFFVRSCPHTWRSHVALQQSTSPYSLLVPGSAILVPKNTYSQSQVGSQWTWAEKPRYILQENCKTCMYKKKHMMDVLQGVYLLLTPHVASLVVLLYFCYMLMTYLNGGNKQQYLIETTVTKKLLTHPRDSSQRSGEFRPIWAPSPGTENLGR